MNDSFRWVDRTLYGEAQGPAQVAYAGVDRLKVYDEPDTASPVQGVLTLHEKVSRYQSQDGFAYVEAEGNVSGWVREQQLVASLPRARKPAAAPQPEAKTPTARDTAAPSEATEAPAESGKSAEPAPDAEPVPDAGAPPEEPVEPERSVFDPY